MRSGRATIEATIEEWSRVAERVVRRRMELGLTQDDVIDRTDGRVTKSVLSLIERAGQERYRLRSVHAVAQALEWSYDSIERILDHQEPQITQSPSLAPSGNSDEVERRLDALEARVAELEARTASDAAPVVQLRPAAKKGRPTRHEFPDG